MLSEYDVIVVGAGHAGCEAANSAAKMGSKVLLVTMNMMTIAQMSCNPAMGGVAKGQIVREIDAMGGLSGIISDKSMIQFRMLNRSKGPAMWSPRTQNDRIRFSEEWRLALEKNPNVDFWQEEVKGILIKNGQVIGVITGLGIEILGKSVILTNGTFLNGIIHIGEKHFGGGRTAEKAATGLTEQLVLIGFESGRMKTGTPPRVDGRSLNYSRFEEQKGDENPGKFSFSDITSPLKQQKSCFITYTNKDVHSILESGFDRSPMYSGRIKGTGPRYCPSIEDKINRFSERDRHQIFVEPEGWNTVEVYVNGFSTSLPEEIQFKALKEIPGFENVKMFRPGYAIEYDFFPPVQLKPTLETKLISNLFFAGQINGTTGYEEAACQGLLAGINAHNIVFKKDPFILKRSEAYIGVLIDDLINKGTDEPYRMFTSRAEYRIMLRQDNADLRLTEKAYHIGLASEKSFYKVKDKKTKISKLINALSKIKLDANEIIPKNEIVKIPINTERLPVTKLIKRPNMHISQISQFCDSVKELIVDYTMQEIEQAEIQIKYETYIEKERNLVNKLESLEKFIIPVNFDYTRVQALSSEGVEKLKRIRPETLGQASRISGVSASDISIIMIYLRK
jgi:tRNA uridine 5-carboxymethylaminomethyl modification enzyme